MLFELGEVKLRDCRILRHQGGFSMLYIYAPNNYGLLPVPMMASQAETWLANKGETLVVLIVRAYSLIMTDDWSLARPFPRRPFPTL